MDTRKYPDGARKEAKRVTRHPLYVALQQRAKQDNADLSAMRTRANELDGEIKRLRDKINALEAEIKAAKKKAA